MTPRDQKCTLRDIEELAEGIYEVRAKLQKQICQNIILRKKTSLFSKHPGSWQIVRGWLVISKKQLLDFFFLFLVGHSLCHRHQLHQDIWVVLESVKSVQLWFRGVCFFHMKDCSTSKWVRRPYFIRMWPHQSLHHSLLMLSRSFFFSLSLLRIWIVPEKLHKCQSVRHCEK